MNTTDSDFKASCTRACVSFVALLAQITPTDCTYVHMYVHSANKHKLALKTSQCSDTLVPFLLIAPSLPPFSFLLCKYDCPRSPLSALLLSALLLSVLLPSALLLSVLLPSALLLSALLLSALPLSALLLSVLLLSVLLLSALLLSALPLSALLLSVLLLSVLLLSALLLSALPLSALLLSALLLSALLLSALLLSALLLSALPLSALPLSALLLSALLLSALLSLHMLLLILFLLSLSPRPPFLHHGPPIPILFTPLSPHPSLSHATTGPPAWPTSKGTPPVPPGRAGCPNCSTRREDLHRLGLCYHWPCLLKTWQTRGS